MTRKHDLLALQRRIAQQERLAPDTAPSTVPLGAAAADVPLPGLEMGALHEILPAGHGDFTAALGFGFGVLASLVRSRPGFVLWVEPCYQAARKGRLYPVSLTAMGIDPDRVIQVSAPKPKNVLWALEEGLGHGALTAVVGVLPENDRAYDFTSSRRLALRAAAHGVTPLLIRDGTQAGMATAAATRWSVAAEPSAPQRRGGPVRPGLGPPRWRVHLSKSKKGLSGQWRLEWDHETLSFRMAAPLADRAPVWPPLLTEQGWATAS